MKEKFVRNKSKIVSAIGAILFFLPIFFLQNTVASGICCVAGLAALLFGASVAKTKWDVIISGILFWAGHGARFCTMFGSYFLFGLFVWLCAIPYTLAIWGSVMLCKLLNKTKVSLLSIFIIPIVYTLVAFIMAVLNFGFAANVITYLMLPIPFLLSLSAIGEYGMTFVFMLVICLVIRVMSDRQKLTKIICGAAAFLLAFVPFVSGCIMLGDNPQADYSISVALATSQQMGFLGECEVAYDMDMQLELFRGALLAAANDNADLLVLNEEYFSVDYQQETDLYEGISIAVGQYGIPVLAGIELVKEKGLSINEALYFNDQGEIEYTYIKNNLVPFVEGGYYVDGREKPAYLTTTIGGYDVNLAFVICFDINDAEYMRKIPSSTELLIVPSWDWDTANVEQLRTAVRSVFLDVTLLKHSFEGFSFVATPMGKRAQTVDFRRKYEKVVTLSVPIWEK